MSTLSTSEIKKGLYGEKHEEYSKASAALVQKGLSFLQGKLSQADVDGEKLFFPFIDTLAAGRGKIAKDLKTPNAALFGHRRDAKGAAPESVTYLDQQYLSYGDRLKTLIGKYLPKLMEGKKAAAGDSECQIHFRTFEIPNLKGAQKLQEHKGMTAIPVKDKQQGSDLISAIAYQQESLFQGCIFDLPPNALRFVSAQLFWKQDDKLVPITEYLGLYDPELTPEEAVKGMKQNPIQQGTLMIENKPCIMIKHMDKELIQSQRERIVPIFKRVVMSKNPDEAALKDDLADIAYRFSHCNGYERGTGGINELMPPILAGLHGYKATFPEGTMIDCEALASPHFPSFKKRFLELLTLTKV